jgi:hypothetical protein
MSTSTLSLVDQRSEKIEQIIAENAIIESVFGRMDAEAKALRGSAGGRKANRVKEVRDIELEMAMEGIDFEPYMVPEANAPKNRQLPLTQEELESNLAKAYAVFTTSQFEITKDSADKRITALLKQAVKRGYTVKDPRKTK